VEAAVIEAVLPSDHHDLATIYNNLGSLFHSKGEIGKAAEYYMKCLEIWKAVLPSNHPDLAAVYNNLGNLFKDKGDLEQATEYYIECLEINQLSELHPRHASVYENLGGLFLENGFLDLSEEFLLECMRIRKLFCSTFHPDRERIFKLLRQLYVAKGDSGKAEFYWRYPD
jgi:tetratricopeptide (TPR) repeat protein